MFWTLPVGKHLPELVLSLFNAHNRRQPFAAPQSRATGTNFLSIPQRLKGILV
jgi:hypothetical protein